MKHIKIKVGYIFFSILFLLGSGIAANYFGVYQKIIQPVLAEDDEEDEDEDEEDDDEHFEVINTKSSGEDTKKNETRTITTKLADTITQTTITTIRHDSDGDGKYDDEDPHPAINEYFIVKDDNSNGVDDQYEPR